MLLGWVFPLLGEGGGNCTQLLRLGGKNGITSAGFGCENPKEGLFLTLDLFLLQNSLQNSSAKFTVVKIHCCSC